MSQQKIHKDQKYIDGLAQNNSFIIQSIYDNFAPKIIHYIKNNNGNSANAQDIIQEVLTTIYQQATIKKLQLTCPFDAYFFLLCKRKWINELKKKLNKEVTTLDNTLSKHISVDELIFETSIDDEKYILFNKMFQKLGNTCKNLLNMCFKTKSMDEVALKLDISYAYARKKKSLCIGKLTEYIRESSNFQRIKNNL
ncbi:sigma-70 family RNA polymerase sigma factor [Tenacibaculum sp. Bg11-29]|uniref:RNA polymerase sigma factor n=1 Tax=Tenacibaculum sp. Bg11-29 TaxID=2058306 RepID=UPI000C33FC22|nr:sigma-70 family RNA polymerase sigma factor [Tenacibaculum sp. Bg11-29]PKH50686.1 sigma-70 family RNA polymerase sigma factor [Tenacibaculum sp. Bg11-29]